MPQNNFSELEPFKATEKKSGGGSPIRLERGAKIFKR